MLSYEKQRILDAICDKKKAIQKQEQQIERCRSRLSRERRFIPARLLEFLISHYKSGIASKEDDIADLEEDLLITDLAIRSQARDNKIIESNESLPFPKDLEVEDETLSKAPAKTSLFSRDFFNIARLREMIDSFTARDEATPAQKDDMPISPDKH